MEIKTIEIRNISGNGLKGDSEGIRHIKTLPCLSVVQPLHGCYEIGLEWKKPCVTEEGGAFAAPAGVRQNIVHHNGTGGYMEAQWVFMNVFINDFFALEDVYDIPLVLPAACRNQLGKLISEIRAEQSICRKYAAAYQLVDLLLAGAVLKDMSFDSGAAQLKRYIDEHYSEEIKKEDLAAVAVCSVPNLYRIFQKHFHLSPHNYINRIRLEKASILLENSGCPVSEVAQKVGFDDPAYFSKLFKEIYMLSPQKYRETLRSLKGKLQEEYSE